MSIYVPLHPVFNVTDDMYEPSHIFLHLSETSSTTSDGVKVDLTEYVDVLISDIPSRHYHIDGYYLLEIDEKGLYLFEEIGNDDVDDKLPFIDTDLNQQLQVIGVDMI